MAISWDHPFGTAECDGLVPVETRVPGEPTHAVTGIGTINTGVGPVVAHDGTVYVGCQEAVLHAIGSDGAIKWFADLGMPVTTPAIIGQDGAIYVVGALLSRATGYYQAWLFRVEPDGSIAWKTQFPELLNEISLGVYSSAPPNIWRVGTDEVIMVPAMEYSNIGSIYSLFAFSATTGNVLAHARLSGPPPQITTDPSSFWGGLEDALVDLFTFFVVDFTPGSAGPPPQYDIGNVQPPQPGAAIFYNPLGGTPFIAATDGYEDIVILTFDNSSNAFTENLRRHDKNYVVHSQPAIMPDAHSVVGTADGRLMFYGPNGVAVDDVKNLKGVFSSPCRTTDGTMIVLGLQQYPNGSVMSIIKNNALYSQTFLNPMAISAPAASFNHIFLNLASGLYTLDATSLEFISEYQWPLNYEGTASGGVSTPAIGPSGQVYAIANNTLYMWPGIRIFHPPGGEVGGIGATRNK